MVHRVAVIPGDGIGKEVLPEGMRVLESAGRRFGFDLEWTTFDWSCEVYTRTGRMIPEDGLDQLRQFDAIYLGAVGFPGVPDHVSLWGAPDSDSPRVSTVHRPQTGTAAHRRTVAAGRARPQTISTW